MIQGLKNLSFSEIEGEMKISIFWRGRMSTEPLGCLTEAVKMKVQSWKGSSDAEGKWLHLQAGTTAGTGTNRLSHSAWECLCTSSLGSTHQTTPISHALSGRSTTQPPSKHLSWGRAGTGTLALAGGCPCSVFSWLQLQTGAGFCFPALCQQHQQLPPHCFPLDSHKAGGTECLQEVCYPHRRSGYETTFLSPLHGAGGTKSRNATLTTSQFSQFSHWIWFLWGTLCKTSLTSWDPWEDLIRVDQSSCKTKTKCWQTLK